MRMMKIVILSVMLFCAAPMGLVWAGQVNINRADASTLAAELKGVGEVKAQAIVDYRKKNGPFTNINDLKNVKGISIKTIEKNQQDLTL